MDKYTVKLNGKLIERRSPGSPRIPEEINKPLRDRLKLARESSGKFSNSFLRVSPELISKIENKDATTLKFGHLYQIAEEMGWSFNDMLKYLAGNEEFTPPTDIMTRRIIPYMSALPEHLQELAVNIIQELVKYHAKESEGVTAQSLQ